MKINKDGKIEIDLQEILDSLGEDEKKQLVKSACISSEVIKWVFDWICGEDEDGWWTTNENRLREDLLARAEDKQLFKDPNRFNWSLIEAATKRLKQLESDKALYWALYHHPAKYELTIAEYLKDKDTWNEFYTTAADKKIDEVINIVKDAIQKK